MANRDVYARRRRRALAACAGLSGLAGVIVGAGAGEDHSPSPPLPPPTVCDRTGPAATALIAGQRVMVRMESRAVRPLLAQARRGEIGGVILFPPADIEADRLAAQIERVQAAAREGGNPPLLVAIDQEGGIVERLPALAPQLSPVALAEQDRAARARREGSAGGLQLRGLGINVNLAPVMDVPSSEAQFMAPRAFGDNPAKVARLALAFATGQRSESLASTAKHFPGLGRALESTDLAPTTIDAPRSALISDMEPFRAASEAGSELIMLSSAAYPGLGSGATPAVLSPAIAGELLREDLGFQGVSISDDLLAPAIALSYSPREAAIRAAAAGVDILLFAAQGAEGVARALREARASGRIAEEDMRASCARILALKESLSVSEPSP
ncbi:MAG: hypothetical protein M3383_01895 [Actinomycetota bacterium]|nr:hypothetical protein [Actinomycetota bacterium]